jgi:hypothetical protein
MFALIELPTLFALIALVMTIGWLLWRSHRYLARQGEGWSPPVRSSRQQADRERPRLGAPDDVIHWEVQMHETARELSGQLDSKMAALAHLIREADRAAGRLEAALASVRRVPDHTPAPEAAIGPTCGSSDELDPPPAQPTDQAEALKSAGAAGRVSVSGEVAREADRQRLPPQERYEEIYLLADYGLDAAEIAHRVGSPVGEVELILGLRGGQ